jgi:hypothetical protein
MNAQCKRYLVWKLADDSYHAVEKRFQCPLVEAHIEWLQREGITAT